MMEQRSLLLIVLLCAQHLHFSSRPFLAACADAGIIFLVSWLLAALLSKTTRTMSQSYIAFNFQGQGRMKLSHRYCLGAPPVN
jgi:hypothetical protein